MSDIVEKMIRSAMGPINTFLNDKKVTEIMLNPDGKIWIERFGEKTKLTDIVMKPEEGMNIIKIVSSANKFEINEENSIISATLPIWKSRFEAIIPPNAKNPMFTIRQPPDRIFTLDEYVEAKIMSIEQKNAICKALHKKENILVAGGTGSGKTTLTNGILNEFNKDERVFILEDTAELQCSVPNCVYLKTSPSKDMTSLLKSTMRHKPTRIIVGEVRDGAAWTMVKAWNTGHPGGIGTLHCDEESGMIRLEQLVMEAGLINIQPILAKTVKIIIDIKYDDLRRQIKGVHRILGYENNKYVMERIA